jgi:hypothetical protein
MRQDRRRNKKSGKYNGQAEHPIFHAANLLQMARQVRHAIAGNLIAWKLTVGNIPLRL